jgi:sugar-specific transcriptional regulator TrmB
MLSTQLTYLGFNEKEARVYLAVMQLAKATAPQIAEFSKVNRATTYLYLRSLISRGLVSSYESVGRVFFVAENPERLIQLLDIRAQEISRQAEYFSTLLPEMRSIFNLAKGKPQIRFFEGKEGLMSMQKDILETKSELLCCFYCIDYVYDVFPDIKKTYSSERVKRQIASKIIYTSRLGVKKFPDDEERLRERRFVPFDKFPFSSDVTIYGNKVAVASLRNDLAGVIIENKQIADSLRLLFELAWEAAGKYNRG